MSSSDKMPRTRTQTGKLPTRAIPVAVLDSDTEDVDNVDGTTIIKEATPERFLFETFTTFNSKHHLRDGLSIVRYLGRGKYELVNLQDVNTDIMGREEIGEYLRSDPQRLEVFEEAVKDIEVSKLSIEQATNSAQFKIFRFQKLPIELRFRIYDFTISATEMLSWDKGEGTHNKLGLGLRLANKEIYAETAGHFYRNNFRITELAVKKPTLAAQAYDAISPHVREITFAWWALAIKDTQTLNAIAALPQLKILNLALSKFCVTTDGGSKPQRTYQDNREIIKFNRTKTFDVLMQIRGLEKVVVTRTLQHGPSTGDLSKIEMERFEKFLNQELTKPIEILVHQEKKKARRVNKRRVYTENDSDDDDFEVSKPRRRINLPPK